MVSLDIHHTSLRARPELIEGTNGGEIEIFGDFPFMLSLVEAFLGFSAELSPLPGASAHQCKCPTESWQRRQASCPPAGVGCAGSMAPTISPWQLRQACSVISRLCGLI